MRYHVKWKGYEKKSDRTWETEDNLEYEHPISRKLVNTILTQVTGALAKSLKPTGIPLAASPP